MRAGFKIDHLIATGGWTGLSPAAPGTIGSLLGLAVGAALLQGSRALLAGGTVFAIVLGVWAIRAVTGQPWGRTPKGAHDDPGWIVIDEIAGQMLTLLALPRLSWTGVIAAFLLFRAFDIAKPGPIGWADRQGGTLSIMADDLLAGLAAGTVLLIGWMMMHDLALHDFP